MTTVMTWLALWAMISTIAALAEAVLWWALFRMHDREREAHALEVKNIHTSYRLQWETFGNMQRFGAPSTPPPVTVSREIDAEERVQRMVSEDTIANGMNELRHLYTAQGLRVPEDDALRSEAISMLGQIEPVIDTATLSRSS